jgi:small subunit ribosomal protein S6e
LKVITLSFSWNESLQGLTNERKPRRLGPKRANKIRKLFSLAKEDDVRKYVVKREIQKGDRKFYKSPKIQRLVTDKRRRRKKTIRVKTILLKHN